MPNARGEGHRWIAGTVTSSTLTSTYAIANWPNQTDQLANNVVYVAWTPPVGIVAPEYSRIARMADGSQRGDGFLKFTWEFSYLTFGMYAYILSNIFASKYSAKCTVMTYDPSNSAVFINATAYRPDIRNLSGIYGGYQDVKFDFDYGVLTS